MAFTPLVRYRNFTLENLKALLEIYPDMSGHILWEEAKDYAEISIKGYKKTAYQMACQLGLEDRSTDKFRNHNYLYTFDEENLSKYLVFWFKIYYAPNPFVYNKDNDEAFILYCRLVENLLQSKDHSVTYEEFFFNNIGGESKDILLNAIKAYAHPVKYKKDREVDILYLEDEDIEAVEQEILFIETNFPILDCNSKGEFFKRFSYINFCKFYDIHEMERENFKNYLELPIKDSKECARILIDYVYKIDGFERISTIFKNNDKSIKIITDDLDGSYLSYVFIKDVSSGFDSRSGGKYRVFLDKEYFFDVEGKVEKSRLSTEWVSTELGQKGARGNYLLALIEKINIFYKDVIEIIQDKQSKKWYLKSVKEFDINELPDCFKTTFAQRYICSLMAKPFVILTGNSGTGKTRISKQFAEYLEVELENDEKNWELISVGADWTDNTKILGFYNPLGNEGKGKYEKTEILNLIERANQPENKNIPFFLILDEMNLSHVERYFADFLSHMEIPGLEFVLDGYPKTVKYPENLFVVGTVNIDETTYMFSPKVLDRANVIEFKPDKNDVLDLFIHPRDNERISPAAFGIAEAFTKQAILIRNGQCSLDEVILEEMRTIFESIYAIVEKRGYEFAYRTVREVRQYISAAYKLASNIEDFNLEKVVDEQLLQKILPKIHGNKKEIGNLLDELERLCSDKKLPLSMEKISKMKGKLANIQYASFI